MCLGCQSFVCARKGAAKCSQIVISMAATIIPGQEEWLSGAVFSCVVTANDRCLSVWAWLWNSIRSFSKLEAFSAQGIWWTICSPRRSPGQRCDDAMPSVTGPYDVYVVSHLLFHPLIDSMGRLIILPQTKDYETQSSICGTAGGSVARFPRNSCSGRSSLGELLDRTRI